MSNCIVLHRGRGIVLTVDSEKVIKRTFRQQADIEHAQKRIFSLLTRSKVDIRKTVKALELNCWMWRYVMSDFYRCFKCNNVVSRIANSKKKCPSCGSARGEVLSQDSFNEGFRIGVFIKTGPKIGKRPEKES
jgi:hypothetical protein